MFFQDPVHEEFATWPFAFAPYGGSDAGEVVTITSRIEDGDDDSFYAAFRAFAEALVHEGDEAALGGHRASAVECYLRAACYLAVAYHPLYGAPVDPRLVDAFHLQMDTFAKAMGALDVPGERLEIPYEGTTIPGWFVRAPEHARETRPTILVGGGWDSTFVENHLAIGIAALRRGYHVVLHDGPGQGHLLVDAGLPLRHDWEQVVTPVVDAALGLDGVDASKLVYEPWSLGGYFAPRVAAHEPRLAAVIADPGQIDVGGKFTGVMGRFGLDDAAIARLPEMRDEDVAKVMGVVEQDRSLHWKIVKRGFWTNGADDLPSWLAEMSKWKLDPDEVATIRTPMLVTAAENDMASSNASELYDALNCPKRFVRFTTEQGAGMHCEMMNRSLANRTILDWLDDTLGV